MNAPRTCHDGAVTERAPTPDPPDAPSPRRRDPAWLWYAVAIAALLAMLLAELSGLLDPLTPG